MNNEKPNCPNSSDEEKFTIEFTYDELKKISCFFGEAETFGDERAKEWKEKIWKILEDYRKNPLDKL